MAHIKAAMALGICSHCRKEWQNLRICTTCGEAKGYLEVENGAVRIKVDSEKINLERAREEAVCESCLLDYGLHIRCKTTKLYPLELELNHTLGDSCIRTECNHASMQRKGPLGLIRSFFTHKNNRSTIDNPDPTSPSPTPIQFDFRRPHLSFDRRVLFGNLDKLANDFVFILKVFDVSTEKHCRISQLKTKISSRAYARTGSLLFLIGGNDVSLSRVQGYSNVEAYDYDSNLYKRLSSLMTPRKKSAALVYNNHLYVAAGYNDGVYLRTVEFCDLSKFDIKKHRSIKWKYTGNLNHPRVDAVLIEFGGNMFLLGGYDGQEYVEHIEVYNMETNQWSDYGYMRGGRAGFSATVFEKRVYIAGGWNSESNTLKTMKSFHPESKEWREEPSMVVPRKYFALATVKKDGRENCIVAMHGFTTGINQWKFARTIEKFNPTAIEPRWRLIEGEAQQG